MPREKEVISKMPKSGSAALISQLKIIREDGLSKTIDLGEGFNAKLIYKDNHVG